MPLSYADISKFKKVVLIYNRNSGKQLFASMLAKINQVHKLLKDWLGAKRVEMWDIRRFDELDVMAQRAVDEQADWVIIAGGDGTIRAMLEKLADKGYLPYISVFPAGTVNLVAKELQLSGDPERWFRRVVKGIESPVYLGRANGHLFLTVAGIGFDSLVVDNVTELGKKLLSKFAYVLQGTELMRRELLFSNWSYKFWVRFDGEQQWHEASSVIVGKSRYYAGRYNLFSGASLSRPLLFAAVFKGNTRVDFMRYTALIGMEALKIDKSILLRSARRIEIRCSEEDFVAELDGDAVTRAPLLLELEPRPALFIA